MGILFVLMVLFAPRGLAGLIQSLVDFLRQRESRQAKENNGPGD
jgi:hypothetical protein